MSGSVESCVDTMPSAWYARAMERLVEVVQRLSLARDLATVMAIVRHAARELTGADGATFVLRDGDRCYYADEDAIEPLWKGQRFPMRICISGWVMEHRSSVVIPDIYADARVPAEAYRPTFVHSLAMVPIRTLDPIGAIGNYWAGQHAASDDEVRVLQALADTTAVAMENVRVYQELESRVAHRTALLQGILDNVQVGVALTVGDRVERANPKLAQILGIAASTDLAGVALPALLRPPEADAALDAALRGGTEREQIFAIETRLERADGEPFWAHIVGKPVGRSGVPGRDGEDGDSGETIWVVDDISAAKLRERTLDELRRAAEASTRFKTEFLASMSHELRTPLNAILGFSEVLRDGLAGELSPRQQEYVNDIFDSGSHLLSLINDVLDLSKIEAGKMTVEADTTDVASLLSGSVSIVKEKALAHDVALATEIAEDIGTAWIDARKLKQIAYNLLSNAVKFTPAGGRVLLRAAAVDRAQALHQLRACTRVSAPAVEISGERLLQLEVADTGIGIDAADIARLFEPFVQIDSSLSRQFQGTGLGLALVRKLCALQGGAVGLSSQPGQGSTFTVWLPLCDGPAADMPEATAVAEHTQAPLVLVIEDDARAADLLRLQLEAAGCRVQRADSAEAASMLLGRERPQAILLDILLPGIDGWSFLAQLKDDDALASIPVIVASIIAESGRGLALGAIDVLQKPVPARRLRDVLRRLGLAAGEPACRHRVLIIDDDAQARDVVAAVLEADGCIALRAVDGEAGLAAAREQRPDLIVLDLLMPGMNGFEVLAALRDDATTAEIPVVVLTGKAMDPDERARLQRHAASLVEKSSFSEQRLRSALRRALPPA